MGELEFLLRDADIGTWGGILLATTVLVGLAKRFLPKIVAGRERLFALVLPIIVSVVSKLSGNFEDVNWASMITLSLIVGASSGEVHDRITNPLLEGTGLKKKKGG